MTTQEKADNARIYVMKTVCGENPITVKLPTLKYFQETIKILVDKIIETNNDAALNVSTAIDSSDIELPDDSKVLEVDASQPVKVNDGKVPIIDEVTLQSLKSRPTSLEINKIIDQLKQDLTDEIEERFNKILNTPDALNRIKSITTYLNEDDNLKLLMQAIMEKVDKETYINHITNEKHLDNNDRKALNVLIKMVRDSFADWNAEEDSAQFIKNKPTALPADGGDADTVRGFGIEWLLNKKAHNLIVGVGLDEYHQLRVNACLRKDFDNRNDIASRIAATDGTVILREGIYYFEELLIAKDRTDISKDCIITGAGNNTNIFKTKTTINQHVKLRDIMFEQCEVHIGSNCEVDNCIFKECDVYMEHSDRSVIRNCNFDTSSISYRGRCTNNFVTGNRFYKYNGVALISSTNVYKDNMVID